jgi:predicted CopG family antitoxin
MSKDFVSKSLRVSHALDEVFKKLSEEKSMSFSALIRSSMIEKLQEDSPGLYKEYVSKVRGEEEHED